MGDAKHDNVLYVRKDVAWKWQRDAIHVVRLLKHCLV